MQLNFLKILLLNVGMGGQKQLHMRKGHNLKKKKNNLWFKGNSFILSAIKVISKFLQQWLEVMLLNEPHCAPTLIPSTRWHFYFPLRLQVLMRDHHINSLLCLNTLKHIFSSFWNYALLWIICASHVAFTLQWAGDILNINCQGSRSCHLLPGNLIWML